MWRCVAATEKEGLGRLGFGVKITIYNRAMDTEDQEEREKGTRKQTKKIRRGVKERKRGSFDSGNGRNSQIFRSSSVEATLLPFQRQVRPHPRQTIWFVVPTYDWSQFLFDQPRTP